MCLPPAGEEAIHQRLIDIAREAEEHRDERITKSLTRIPPALMGFVDAMSAALGALVFVYPFHNTRAGIACFTLVAAVLLLANIVMTDLDNPFNEYTTSVPSRFLACTKVATTVGPPEHAVTVRAWVKGAVLSCGFEPKCRALASPPSHGNGGNRGRACHDVAIVVVTSPSLAPRSALPEDLSPDV